MTAEGASLAFVIASAIAGGIWRMSAFASRLETVGKRGHENSNDLEKIHAEIDSLREVQIRDDERLKTLDGHYERLERKIDGIDYKLDRLLTRTPLPR
jgi:predicted  nucleic acid-binding Zn-ribbon protein